MGNDNLICLLKTFDLKHCFCGKVRRLLTLLFWNKNMKHAAEYYHNCLHTFYSFADYKRKTHNGH